MRRWLFRQKYRFDMGAQLMALINFALLVVAVGDKLGLPIHSWRLALVAIPAAFGGVWMLGMALDKVGYAHAINTEIMSRNPPWDRQMAILARIERQTQLIRATLPWRQFEPIPEPESDPNSICSQVCGWCGGCT